MKPFMDADFLLETHTARALYRQSAAAEPIFDYHCHLNPAQIAANKQFADLAEIWLGGDHYKWRQMRTFGIGEELVTGCADPYDKFLAWARTVENLIGNPLYHWTHLELQRFFGISEVLNAYTAPAIWKEANAKLASEELSVRGIFSRMHVHAVGTTDDPVDTLEHHLAIASGTARIGKTDTLVLPTFRPDKALNIDHEGFAEYMAKLELSSGAAIKSVRDVIDALAARLDFFAAAGCRASDHALEHPPCRVLGDQELDAIFRTAMAGGGVSAEQADAWKTRLLTALAREYKKRSIAMQLHFGALRNANRRAFAVLGADAGFDASQDRKVSGSLARLLSLMEEQDGLPRTILYTLNPKDYYPLGTLAGCFQGDGIPGKIQLGSAWWFCDHRDGMEEQLRVLANLGMLSAFVGMLTDSRSFLSYPRHEYFRRILCNLLGTWVENGEYPADMDKLGEIVRGISFRNAARYFSNCAEQV